MALPSGTKYWYAVDFSALLNEPTIPSSTAAQRSSFLASSTVGSAAIAAFAGGETALFQCYLVDSPPEAEPEIAIRIPGVSFDADLRPVLGGRLLQHGAERTNSVNGAIRLYHAASLADLPATTNSVEFGRTFPVDPAPIEGLEGDTRFFQLRLE